MAVIDDYGDREELGALQAEASAAFNDERLDVLRAGETLEAELTEDPDPVARTEEEKGISLRDLERALADASERSAAAYDGLRERWFEKLLGPERDDPPTSFHMAYLRRLSPLAHTYTKERAVEVCLDDARPARLRPLERAEHPARPRRPAAEVAARVRDRRPTRRRSCT